MKNLTCLNRTSSCYDNNEDCKDVIVTSSCKKNEVCVAVIGFRGHNVSRPEIRFASCFPDPQCSPNSPNLSNCIATYDPNMPFVRDVFCCCNQPMCNTNFTLNPQNHQESRQHGQIIKTPSVNPTGSSH